MIHHTGGHRGVEQRLKGWLEVLPEVRRQSVESWISGVQGRGEPAPGRAVDLQVRVSAPVTGSELPIILLSHGHRRSNHLSSLNGYAPLANYWAHRLLQNDDARARDRRRQGRLSPPICPGDSAWQEAQNALTGGANRLGRVESK